MIKYLTKLKNKKYIVLLVAYVFLLMLFCAGSSPLINHASRDSSVFFLIGKGMAFGKIAYKDLFDHKGIYLYFINYLGALIDSKYQVGIYIIESIFVLFDALLIIKIVDIFFKNKKIEIISSCLMLLLILNGFTYQSGNLTEEYCLTFQLISIYCICLNIKNNSNKHNPLFMLIQGLCVGIVLNIRANMILMWVPIALNTIVDLLIKKEYWNVLQNIICGFIGVILGIFPVLLYSILTNSYMEMYHSAFVFNVKYSNVDGIISNLLISFVSSRVIWILLLMTISFFILMKAKMQLKGKIMYCSIAVASVLCVGLSGKAYGHYYEYLIPLYLPSAIFVAFIIEKKFKTVPMFIFLSIFFCGTAYFNTEFINKYYSDSKSLSIVDKLEKLKMSGIINENDNILATGNNVIVYNELNNIPNFKYFYLPSIDYESYPDAVDSQVALILDNYFDAIVVCDYKKNNQLFKNNDINIIVNEYIKKNYEISFEIDDFVVYHK